MNFEVESIDVKKDERGWLIEVFKKSVIKKLGQVYLSVAKPGITRGGHYHGRKTEWFCVVSGRGELALMDMSTKEKRRISMDSGKPCLVRIGPRVAHKITNTGNDDLYLLAHIDEEFDESDPDTFRADF